MVDKKAVLLKPLIKITLFSVSLLLTLFVKAQDNYEIQVYGSPTVGKDTTMLELHSNFTFNGEKHIKNDVLPSNHIFHETIEITHGFTDWMEVGFYIFTAIGDNNRTSYVGSHIRPRVMAPIKWKWPIGVSISAEFGYQKRQYSEDDWSLELRPIIDKKIKKLYVALNPTFDKSFHGLNKNSGFIFSPNVKIGYDLTSIISPGIEYYGSMGPINNISPYSQQQQQLFLVADINFSAEWEFNIGYGFGFTESTDKSIFKVILGKRFGK
jgi:hypothetical protein